jgi:glycosyltransferase involved in cell wall biosynthesis
MVGESALDIFLACDTMTSLEGSIRPALYLARGLVARGYKVSMISPVVSNFVENYLRSEGINVVNLQLKLLSYRFGSSVLWFEAWAREAFLKLNSMIINDPPPVIVNFSNLLVIPSFVWYLQGPLSIAMEDMEKEFSFSIRVFYNLIKPAINVGDKKFIGRMKNASTLMVANSKFCAHLYSKFGMKVDHVIYPPLDREIFRPSTSNPSSGYVLTYFGKETKFSVIKRIADCGVKVRAFGFKLPFIRKDVINHPNVKFLGHVSSKELVNLYSNALFTIFPFTHEPFGYIPLESMACGTPVLTYGSQGPGEYVVNNEVGWLVSSDEQIIKKTLELWSRGYPAKMRCNCLEASKNFDKDKYVDDMLKLLIPFLK